MEKKRIVLISHNDLLGGAAVVTYRLMHTLREMGHEADMLVFNKASLDEHVHRIGKPLMRGFKFMKERIGIFYRNGFDRKNLFKVSTGKTGQSVVNHPLVKQADAIIINWVNQATLSLDEIRRLADTGKKIIWTMHDMWCMTGICHHAYECERYKDACGNCPYLNGHGHDNDISAKTLRLKKSLYDATNIQFVAVSSWVRERAMKSALLKDRDVKVIHNAFPSKLFPIKPSKPYAPITDTKFKRAIAFGAARLDDPIKGLNYAIDALNILVDKYPEDAAGTAAMFFGACQDEHIFDRLRFPHIICGTISGIDSLQHIYCKSDVVLSTSLYETLGGTLIEGMSSGAVPVSFGQGGQTDIIDHRSTGYVARYLDAADIAEGIHWAFHANIPRRKLHDTVAERFGAENIARQYLDLIDSQ